MIQTVSKTSCKTIWSEKMKQVVQKESHKSVWIIYVVEKANICVIDYEFKWTEDLYGQFLHLVGPLFVFLLSVILSSRPFEIIRCCVESLIATSVYFSLKYEWKKKIWNMFFGAQTSIPVFQTIWMCHCKYLPTRKGFHENNSV